MRKSLKVRGVKARRAKARSFPLALSSLRYSTFYPAYHLTLSVLRDQIDSEFVSYVGAA